MKIIRKKAFTLPILLLFLLAAVALSVNGCAKKTHDDISIELEALDGAAPSSSDALFPSFVSGDKDSQKKLEKLNREVEKVRNNYVERRQKDKGFIVHTYVKSVKNVPQCTLFWYEEHSLLGDDYNLMTLAFNKNTGEPMTSKEALDSLEIDGVALSTNVGKLFQELQPSLKLRETEMQGFETDENGTVTRIYMKLIAQKEVINEETQEPEITEEIHFYYYDPAEESLGHISELGYEIP